MDPDGHEDNIKCILIDQRRLPGLTEYFRTAVDVQIYLQ